MHLEELERLAKGVCLLTCGVGLIAGAKAAPYRDGDRVVFFGDSITHAAGYPEAVALYYVTRFPDRDIRFFNAGWCGAQASQGLESVDEDVAANRPTVVSIMFGMNDSGYYVRSRYRLVTDEEAAADAAVAQYAKLMPQLVADVRRKAGNPRIQYVTPSPYEQNAIFRGEQGAVVANDWLRRLSDLVRGWARADGAECLDLQEGLRLVNEREQALDPTFTILADGNGFTDRVHPGGGGVGSTLFAYFWLKGQGAPSVVSRLEIDARTGRPGACENAEVRDVVCASNTVSFAALEKALPYPLEGAARRAARLVPFLEDLNSEKLVVKNLASGGYDILIDGVKVTGRSAMELASGVELAALAETPQYKQACAVQKENAEHWAATALMRDLITRRRWMRGHYHIDPDDPKAVRKHIEDLDAANNHSYDYVLACVYEKNWPHVGETRAKLERTRLKARELAQPVWHRWTIRPAVEIKKEAKK